MVRLTGIFVRTVRNGVCVAMPGQHPVSRERLEIPVCPSGLAWERRTD